MDRFGFIGLGSMGGSLSKRLVESGFELVVHDSEPEKAKYLLNRGAAWADTPALVAQAADLILTAPVDSSLLDSVIAGPSGILEGSLPGLVVLNLSPATPEQIERLGAVCKENEVILFDIPLDGSPGECGPDLKAKLPEEVYSKYQPILDALCGTAARPE